MKDRAILYIEDNFHNRRIVRKILTVNGYSVVEADDGLLGLEMIKELKPPLVLLDIALPGMDGMEIAERVKADEALRGVPLVALTASAMRGDRERFLAAGCDGYLSKPFKAHELVEVVENYYDSTNGKSHVSHNGHDNEHKLGLETNDATERVSAETEMVRVDEIMETEPEAEFTREEAVEESPPDTFEETQLEVENVVVEMGEAEDTDHDLVAPDDTKDDIEAEENSQELMADATFELEIEDRGAEEAKAEDAELSPEMQVETELEEPDPEVGDRIEIEFEEPILSTKDDLLTDDIDTEPEVNGAKPDVFAFEAEAEANIAEVEAQEDLEADADEMLEDEDEGDDDVDGDYDEKFVSQLIERLELSEIVPSLPDLDDFEVGDPGMSLQDTGPKTILIIEDNVYDARLLRRMFESQKYTVKVIQTGEAALRYLEDNLPTAILLDLVLPDMRGEDVLSMIRVNRYTAPIPVIVVSVKELDPIARLSLTEQADSVWSKELLDYRALFTYVNDLIHAREAK